MLLASPAGLLALVLLSTPSDISAARAVDECEAASPRIELSPMPSTGQAPVVCISPGLPTTFRFDSTLQPESLGLPERGLFEDWAVGQRTLTLVPRRNGVAGTRTEVEVCFADGAAPPCATVVLVVHPGLGPQDVQVLRQPRPVEHFQQVAQEAEAEVGQCRAEVRQLRAERGAPDGLGGAIVSGLVSGTGGVAVKDLGVGVHEEARKFGPGSRRSSPPSRKGSTSTEITGTRGSPCTTVRCGQAG